MDYPKADATLKIQFLRMQLEIIAYSRIQRKLATESILSKFEEFWLAACREAEIVPANNFMDEYAEFSEKSLLKFAPDQTYANMEIKAFMTIEKNGFDVGEIKKIIDA